MILFLIGMATGILYTGIYGYYLINRTWHKAYDLGLKHGLDGTPEAARKRASKGQV